MPPRFLRLLLLFVGSATAALAAASVANLEVFPTSLRFESRRAARQLVITANIEGTPRDVTHLARISSSNDRVVSVDHGYAVAAGDGQASLTIDWQGQTLRVPVTVVRYEEPDPVQFKFETMAVLTKQGCATGSCHGSPQGKAGFALSLFGYDPTIDRRSLTRDGFNRRIDVMEPEQSLMLRKPLLELAHVGGKRLRHGETPYRTLRDWIAEGANVELPAVECERIVVYPGTERVLTAPFLSQQLSVLAYYSDGTVRDVTTIAAYDTSSADLATVDANGRVTGHRRGQAAISVRYLAQLQSVYFTIIEDVPGFAWKAPSESNFVDTLVNAKLRQLQYLPAETCDDATFVRRVRLDLTGLIPTSEEARSFIDNKSPRKRAELVNRLLESDAFARFWASKQADLMRVSKTRLKDGRAEAFSAWLVNSIRDDVPYDRFARQLLTATGDTRDVPAASFFVAIPGPEERTEMTAQLFLGSRLECAKCHNHPYEKWTMRDYYSLAAVYARTSVDQGVVQVVDSGETLHPTTKQAVRPWGETPGATMADRRTAFADWLAQPDNPLFARVEVNRIWAHLLGRGIVDPVDDFRSSNPPANAPLLDALAQEFVKSGFRRKHIIRLICNSQTYQRSMETSALNAGDEILFSHARPRLLTAEQLKDAVGLAARMLAPVESLPAQIAANRAALDRRHQELAAGFPAWLDNAAADVAARDFWMGTWYSVGPFSGGSRAETRDQDFGPEQFPVDFAATFDEGRRRWHSHPEWNDPDQTYAVDSARDAAVYVARRIYSHEARTLPVGVRGATTLWCNGKTVGRGGGNQNGERRLQLELTPGVNYVVMKIASRQDDAQFRFRATEPKPDESAPPRLPLPPQAIELLAKPIAQLTDEDRAALRELHPLTDETFQSLRSKLAAQEQHLEYATQRPYPEAQPFMVAFGQPKRETACSCERTTSPTLLQALELLNGGTMHQAVQSGTERYDGFNDEKLIDELYLSALARYPNARERQSGSEFLHQASERSDAVMDLLWSVLNTREFLFQH
jgi:hypothetical protein